LLDAHDPSYLSGRSPAVNANSASNYRYGVPVCNARAWSFPPISALSAS
jgi:hypothetical protein